jgi:hypothetical protein
MTSIQDRLTERRWKNDTDVDLMCCPFCGCEHIVKEERHSEVRLHCKDCGCGTPYVGMFTIAVGLWNRRAYKSTEETQ